MSKILIAIVIVLIVGVAGWMLLGNKMGNAPMGQTPESSMPTAEATVPPVVVENEITVPLLIQNNSGQMGKAVLTQVRGQVNVHLEVKGEPAGASEPAHIHIGACPVPGAVKYPLSPVVNGVSDTVINETIETISKQLPLAINIHKSAQELGSYIACGDVKF